MNSEDIKNFKEKAIVENKKEKERNDALYNGLACIDCINRAKTIITACGEYRNGKPEEILNGGKCKYHKHIDPRERFFLHAEDVIVVEGS